MLLRRIRAEWAAVIIALLGLLLGGVVWGARLEERVNAHDRALATVEEQHREAVQQFRDDLAYIRRRLDEALDRGGLR